MGPTMTWNAPNSIRTADAISAVQWFKMRVLGGQQFGALINALHSAVFFGLSYVGLTILTGWAQRVMAMLGTAEQQ